MYTYNILGQRLDVHRIQYDSGITMWYYDVNKSGNANDHYFLKRNAKSAGIEWIKEHYTKTTKSCTQD